MLVRLLRPVRSITLILATRHPSTTLIGCGLLSLIAMALASFVASTLVVGANVEQRAAHRLQNNILVVERILRDLGPVHLDGTRLMVGRTVLDGQERFVDDMSLMLGGDVTVFHGDLRVATTLRQGRQRAVGTRLARGPAYSALFDRHQSYRGPAHVLGVDFYAAYDPLCGPDGRVIGAVFIGLPREYFRSAVTAAQHSIELTSFGVLLLASLAFGAVARPLKREIDGRERKLRELADRLDLAFANMSDGLSLFSSDKRLLAFNQRYTTLYGIDPARLTEGMTLTEVLAVHEHAGTFPVEWDAAAMREAIEYPRTGTPPGETTFHGRDGRIFTISYESLADGGWVTTHRDVTSQIHDQERMRFLALHDPLTGLANRAAFNAALLDRLKQSASHFFVLLIDLDRFKAVNDLYGHGGGDALLREVAARLNREVPGASIAARLGGDEFALLVENICEIESVEAFAHKILNTLSEPFVFAGDAIRTRASIGITSAGNGSFTLDEVLGQADLALYASKAQGRGVFNLFRPELAADQQNRHELKREMLFAFTNGEFVLHYQPQYAVATRELIGFEALVRWQHPSRGLLYPGDFISLAEESGLIARLGAWVIEQACHDACAWGNDVSVAVNVSAVQLAQSNFVADTIEVVNRIGLRLDLLEVEVTETVLLEDTPEIVHTLSALRSAGIRVALDDFGTGYSSLLYLRRLPFDCIKIDQSFVRDLGTWQETASIAGIIIQLAQSFGATTIAEGVEQESQFCELRALGCDLVQGYHFSKPVPFSAAQDLVSRRLLAPAQEDLSGRHLTMDPVR